MVEAALDIARSSGLVTQQRPLLVMLSGGPDSVCLVDICHRLGAEVTALHINYGLREASDDDEAHCLSLCDSLGIPLIVERVALDPTEPGNLQNKARELRYAYAERYAQTDYATAHTASDQAETILYRLATSPGRRALLGMQPRKGRLVRPLLGTTREQTREYCAGRGLSWREDESNNDLHFARARIRHRLLPELRELNPQVERAIVETSGLLSDEMEVLERAVDEAVGRLGDRAVALGELREEPRGLARMILRRMAETASRDAGANVAQSSLSRDDADAILALGGAQNGGSVSLDLGGGLRAVCEYGILRFTYSTDPPPPAPVSLPVPGTVRFGDWEVEARSDTAGDALVSADKLADILTVRSWVSGDRMRPAGLGGSKSLQDLFTDRKVPRALRRTLPVVESEGEIVWVAGVSVDERFVIASDGPEHGNVIALVARRLNR